MKTQRTKADILKLNIYLYIIAVWSLLVTGGNFHAAISFLISSVPSQNVPLPILKEIPSRTSEDVPLLISKEIPFGTSGDVPLPISKEIPSEISGDSSLGSSCNVSLEVLQDINKKINQNTTSFTSTRYRYDKKFQKTLLHYQNFASLYKADFSTAVPGLESTDVLGESCNQMVPQGICIAGEYMLVTAYDNIDLYNKKKLTNHKVNNSVIYILSNQNPKKRKLLTTIILPDINHVGGITFDGKNVWIAKSTDRQCSVISYDIIKEAAKSGKSSYKLPKYNQNVFCNTVASFVTWHENMLWIGTYSNCINKKGSLQSYKVRKEKTEHGKSFILQKQDEIVIPNYANGAAFMEVEGKTYLTISTSKGRYFDSEIYFYKVYEDYLTGKKLYYNYDILKFPPMAEELVCDKENMYFLFESSATCYSTLNYQRCNYPVDRICAVSVRQLLEQKKKFICQKADFGKKKFQIPIIIEDMYAEKKYWQKLV